MKRLTKRLVPVFLLAAAAGGCSTAASSATSATSATSTTSPSQGATPSATQTPSPSLGTFPSAPSAPIVVTLQGSYAPYTISSDGPLAVLAEGPLEYVDEPDPTNPNHWSSVVLVDLSQRSTRTLARAAAGYTVSQPVIRGDTVAWIEWRYSGPWFSGPCAWRILALSLRTGESRVLASGTNPRYEGGAGSGAPPPHLALDRTEVAYAAQSTSAARWQIRVLSLPTGQITRMIQTETGMGLECLGLSDGVVAYTERLPDATNPRLMLSTPEQPAPRQLASNVDDLSFRDGRLAWVEHASDLATSRLFIASTDWQPVPITDGSSQVTAPAASDLGVSYATGTAGDSGMWTWDAATGRARVLAVAEGAFLSDHGSGWLTYVGFEGDSATVVGMVWPRP